MTKQTLIDKIKASGAVPEMKEYDWFNDCEKNHHQKVGWNNAIEETDLPKIIDVVLEEVRNNVPKRLNNNELDSTLFDDGWNACREEVLKILQK